MLITIDILKQHGACPNGQEWFIKKYPNGAEIIDLINDEETPYEMLHYGYLKLPITEEEKEAYYKRCDIENSYNVLSSEVVYNSEYVIKSNTVEDSERIRYSNEVYRSNNINGSSNVGDSDHIMNSTNVMDSHLIWGSNDINSCAQVIDSSDVECSLYVADSNHVFFSRFIYTSDNIEDCLFCARSNNLNRSICCYDINDKNNYIFNQEVSPERFDEVYEHLNFLLSAQCKPLLSATWKSGFSDLLHKEIPNYELNSLAAQEAIDYLKSIPEYDDFVLQLLFFKI